ncbi:MAG: phosphatidylserine decarboxylase family protein [Elusimicrobiota bacterium]
MKLPIAREGFVFIKICLSLTLIFLIIGQSYRHKILLGFSVIFLLLLLFVIFFFRDPERKIDAAKNLVISPGDGRVLEITEEQNIFVGKAKVVKIFLSVFNVHIQRSPVAGRVAFIQYNEGKFLPANCPKASLENEQNWIGIENKEGKVLVKQIAGLIARRIACWVKMGEDVDQGRRIGLIRFGSQVDLYFPVSWDVQVKVGQKVKAGVTVIGAIGRTKVEKEVFQ